MVVKDNTGSLSNVNPAVGVYVGDEGTVTDTLVTGNAGVRIGGQGRNKVSNSRADNNESNGMELIGATVVNCQANYNGGHWNIRIPREFDYREYG